MKKTWLLGSGFFSISLVWALYNAFVPFFLEKFIMSTAIIGFLMTIDNYIALFLQPAVGYASDKIDTRFGKRMPFLMIGMPLAAIFTILVPNHTSLITLILFMVALNLSMAIFRSPTIALMPDITPEKNRTKANGIINFMGGAAAILAFAIGSALYKIHHTFPFYLAAIVLILALFLLLRSINEKRDTIEYKKHIKPKINVKKELNRSTVFLLMAIFFWFVSYQGMEALFTLYGKNELGLAEDQASFSLAFFSLTFVLFALPSGMLAARFGKKLMIMIGIAGLTTVFLLLTFVDTVGLLRILLLFGGMFWACININSYPFVVSTGSEEAIGTRTGLYYLVSSLAAITGPVLFGVVIDLTSYGILFYVAALFMVLAFVSVLFIKDPGLKKDMPKEVDA